MENDLKVLGLLVEWDRQGMLVWADEIDYSLELASVSGIPHVSDDLHILALARATSSRLLYTDDSDLIEDFKNKDIINNPHGKVIQSTGRIRMIRRLLDKLGS